MLNLDFLILIWDDKQMTSIKIVYFSRPPTPCQFFYPIGLGCPILNEPPTLSNKLWNNNHIVHVNERNQNKNKTKSRHIQIDYAFYCSI